MVYFLKLAEHVYIQYVCVCDTLYIKQDDWDIKKSPAFMVSYNSLQWYNM